jgi:hypothetical protein
MTAPWRIPKMTDPLGRHWKQPRGLHSRVELYFSHAYISEKDWNALPRYESSTPSGVYPGKVWRRGKYLCWYGPEQQGTGGALAFCRIGRLRALVYGPGTNASYAPLRRPRYSKVSRFLPCYNNGTMCTHCGSRHCEHGAFDQCPAAGES